MRRPAEWGAVVAEAVDVEVGAELPPEPVSASCPEPTYIAERTLGRDEVLVYTPVSGQWSVGPRGSLTPDTSWWSAGELHRGGTVVGQASIESLRLADVAYESAPHHDAPCRRSWVLVLDEGPAHHAQLSEVREGALIAYGGRLLRTGEGWVQPTGEVLSQVVDTFSRTAEGVYELEVELPDGSLVWLSATAEHPFYAVGAGTYVSVRELGVGERLHVEGGGDALLVSKTWRQGGVEVFNFEVEGEHNYFAGGLLTHNPPGCPPPSLAPKGCKRGGAFRAAKRHCGILMNWAFRMTKETSRRKGKKVTTTWYDFVVPWLNGAEPIRIRDDAGGHDYGPGSPQNRGPHFNTPDGEHFDYGCGCG